MSRTNHRTYVQTGGRLGFFASCATCGCDGFPDRASRDEAEVDARDHGEFRDMAMPYMIGSGPLTTGYGPFATSGGAVATSIGLFS